MKVGDLVTGKKDGTYDGSVGVIFGFDKDNDPVVFWFNDMGSNDVSPGCGEFKNQMMVLNAAR